MDAEATHPAARPGLAMLVCCTLLVATAAAAQSPSIKDWHPACDGVADDSLAVRTATAALANTGAAIHIPYDCRLLMGPAARLAGGPAVLDGVGLVGDGGRDSGDPARRYGTRGGTILLADPGGPAFMARRNWRLQGLIFDWPAQTEGPDAPHPMPPLLTGPAGAAAAPGEVSAGRFIDNDVVNAFVLMDFAADLSGALQIRDNRIWCLSVCLRLGLMPAESWVSGNQFTPNADWSADGVGLGASFRLRDAGAHAAVMQFVGDGTAQTPSRQHVDGLSFSDNTVFGMGYALRITGGWANLVTMTDNRLDGVPHVIAVEEGGRITGTTLSGGLWFSYQFGAMAEPVTPITAVAAIPPGSLLSIDNVSVPASTGGLVDWRAPGSDLSLTNLRATGLNNLPGATQPAIRFSSAGGRLRVIASELSNVFAKAGPCIQLTEPLQMLTVALNQFVHCAAPISAARPVGSAMVTGNQSLGTTGGWAYAGPSAAALPAAGNVWDRPIPPPAAPSPPPPGTAR